MALAMSSASPMALSLVVFTSKTSSNALDTQRKAIDAPTLPLPIIEINYLQTRGKGFQSFLLRILAL